MTPYEIVVYIEKILIDRHITKADFYASTGISAAVMSNWRKGTNYPSMAALIAINEYLGTDFAITVENNKKTVLMTMHNVTSAIRYANDVIILNDGKIEFFGSKDDAVSSGVIERVFSVTHEMINGIDVYLSK